MHLDRRDVADAIKRASTAGLVKKASKVLRYDPNSGKWDNIKGDLMRDLLWDKVKQCSLFREELLKSYPKRLTHILPGTKDRFWATLYVSNYNGKTYQGQDVFAKLLMEIRESLVNRAYPPCPPSHVQLTGILFCRIS
jgi:predicted NAD-dependent protein-ADP-ribosyltransferase YbiA (DUF1768 family)